MAVVECSKTWQLLATHTAMVFDSDRGCTVIFWGFRRFEPVKCEELSSPEAVYPIACIGRKKTFPVPLTEALQRLSASKYASSPPPLRPPQKPHVCSDWVFLWYHTKLLKWAAQTRIRKKLEGDAPAAVSLCLSPKTLQCLSDEQHGCCITSGQTGSSGVKMC